MAITTIAGANAGAVLVRNFIKAAPGNAISSHPSSLFYTAGYPAAAAAPTPGIGGAVLTSYAGQIPFDNPVSGNTYLSRFQGVGTGSAGTLLICDRLWHNSGIDLTIATEQAFTSSAQIPARDATGTNSGIGVYAALEFSAQGGAAAPVYTFKYTNQSGITGQTATTVVASANTPTAGKFCVFALAAGDTGVQKAESITLSTSQLSGTAHVVLFRVIARLDIGSPYWANAQDALKTGFVRCYDSTVPFLVYIPVSTTGFSGHIIFAQG